MWARELGAMRASEARPYVRAIEALGYGAVWIPETVGGKEILAHAAVLLAATDRIVVAAGVANIWARDAMAAANGARVLEDAFPGRFVLGLGVSHAPNAAVRGHAYRDPLSTMRAYLDAMDAAAFSVPGTRQAPRLLAALGPRMLALAAERSAGAHPYLVTPTFTRDARRRLGPRPVLAVEQAVALSGNAAAARLAAREHVRRYVALPNYRRNLLAMGWSDRELDETTDRVLEGLVAQGGAVDATALIQAHLDAGADHVAVQVLGPTPEAGHLAVLRSLIDAYPSARADRPARAR